DRAVRHVSLLPEQPTPYPPSSMSIHANVNPVFHGLGLQYDHGETPAVAITRLGRVVELHRAEKTYPLYHRVGDLNEATIIWEQSIRYGTGITPHLASNNHNVVVEVHESSRTAIAYRVGNIVGTNIVWGKNLRITSGRDPSVALTDDGTVIITYEYGKTDLCRWTGTVNGKQIDWFGKPLKFDDGE